MKGPIARGTIRTTWVLGLRLAVQAGTLLLVARMLGPHRFGAFAGVAALAVMLGTLSTFGTHLVLLGEVSKEPARRHEVLRYAIPTTLLCGVLLLTNYLLICTLLLRTVGVSLHVILILGIAEVLLQPIIVLCASEHHGLGRVARSQLLTILPLWLRLAAAAAVFALHTARPLDAYAYGYGLASLIALALVLSFLPERWPPPRAWHLPRWPELREAIGFAALGLTRAGPAELDKTLAARLLPLASAGVYASSARVIAATTVPVVAMIQSSLPRLFREGRDDGGRTRQLSQWMLTAAGAYGVLLASVLWVAAPVLETLFGARYAGITTMTRLLCPAIPGLALRLVTGSVLVAVRHPVLRISFEAAGITLLIAASIFLVPMFGSIGMAVALSTSEWGMALIGLLLTLKVLRHEVSMRTPDTPRTHPS